VVDAGEHLDERRLSCSVGTEEGEDAAGLDVQIDPGQREGTAEPLDEAADADQRFHGHLR
jgi:hypothetical protein